MNFMPNRKGKIMSNEQTPLKEFRGKMAEFADAIGEAIIEQLTGGDLPPWQKPFDAYGTRAFSEAFNATSGNNYNGGNALGVIVHRLRNKFRTGGYLTFKQALDLGGHVKKGEKALRVIKFGEVSGKETDTAAESTNDATKEKKRVYIKFYSVFNVDQCEGIENAKHFPAPAPVPEWQTLETCEKLAQAQGVEIRHEDAGGFAYFSPMGNSVTMPAKGFFPNAQEYYATLFHELSHAAAKQLKLDFGGYNNIAGRAREETAVEISAMLICGKLGIGKPEADQNHKAYAAHWLKILKADKSEALRAWNAAQAIANKVFENAQD